MSPDFVTGLILEYRYWILIPLTFIEGPIVAFMAGTLASVGFFSITTLAIVFFVRDVALDALCYTTGHFWSTSAFARNMLTKIGVTEERLERARTLWMTRPGITLFIGKLAYGISAAFVVAAGMMRMPLTTFFSYSIVVTILQYGSLLFLGYFLGTSFGGSVEKILRNVQYMVLFSAIAIGAYMYIVWRVRKRLIADDQKLGEEN